MYCLRRCQADHDDAETGCKLGTPTGFDVSMTAGPFTKAERACVGYKLLGCLFVVFLVCI